MGASHGNETVDRTGKLLGLIASTALVWRRTARKAIYVSGVAPSSALARAPRAGEGELCPKTTNSQKAI